MADGFCVQTNRLATRFSGMGSQPTILVVEDDSDVRGLLSEILLDAGYNVITMRTADDALPVIESDRPIDLLFTDILMPGQLNGIDLAKATHRLRPTLPIVFTTAYGDTDLFRREGIAESRILNKPYLPGQIEEEVAAALGAAA
jgi:DNA-binding NtrC family response regulator